MLKKIELTIYAETTEEFRRLAREGADSTDIDQLNYGWSRGSGEPGGPPRAGNMCCIVTPMPPPNRYTIARGKAMASP